MKTLVIYTSQTGFTQRYARWLAERLNADVLETEEAQKRPKDYFDQYQAIAYGGWVMAGKVAKVNWFLKQAAAWKGKRLAVFCVGGSPQGSRDAEILLQHLLNDEQKQTIRVFYCQGGYNYEKMNGPSRLAMKLVASALRKKKDATEEEKKRAEAMSSSFDMSDKRFIEPIAAYLEGNA